MGVELGQGNAIKSVFHVRAGIRPLYHGVGYSIPRAIIGSGSHFVFYETTRKILLRKEKAERDRLHALQTGD
jgi:hypothetical protein